MYNVLVWASEAGKFAKEFCIKQKVAECINKILILGNEMRIEDLKALNIIENSGVPVVIDEDVFGAKRDTELFILGKCAAEREFNDSLSDLGLVTYSSADKSTVEAAKRLNLPLITWTGLNNTKQQTSRTRNVTKKTETKTTVARTKKEAILRETEKEISANTKVSIQKNNSTIGKLLKNAKLPKEITGLLTQEMLHNIERAVNNASDPEIGLPMLIKMYCGFTEEISKQIAKVIAPEFKTLKSM